MLVGVMESAQQRTGRVWAASEVFFGTAARLGGGEVLAVTDATGTTRSSLVVRGRRTFSGS